MQVHYDEGLANHIGPEPCGGLREGTDEKSVGFTFRTLFPGSRMIFWRSTPQGTCGSPLDCSKRVSLCSCLRSSP